MYLKALEIYGFKSFANKAKMPLKPGITCIVGPNGCGKSNIVDSIKWCIGEMSWKSLRMPSMMDIIFSGTTHRKSLNMAEVSMTFDNSERKLPLDFSEVTVTRKIYRSEESEYFINKVQCRLKDIREMFLDTGIGTDGYAIINQGQVDKVLNASAEQRREMFEEAAGVSKYKSKREEAVFRLEKVQADLNRLSDSMVLLQEQIKKLEAEARKAKLQQKYREELQSAEIALLLSEYKAFESSLGKSRSELAPIIREQEDLQVSVNAMEAEISAMGISISEKKAELIRLTEKINALKLEKNNLEGIIRHNNQSLQDIKASRLSLEMSEKSNQEKISRTEPYIRKLAEQIEAEKKSQPDLKEKAAKAREILEETQEKIKKTESLYSEMSAKLNEAFSREIKMSQFLARSNSDISHYKENLKSLERDRGMLEANEKRLDEEFSKYGEKISKLKKSLEEEKNKNSEAEQMTRQVSGKINKAGQRISDIRAERAALQARLDALIAQARKNSYWVGQKAVLKASLPGVLGSLRGFLKIRKKDLVAAEDALGKYLDSIVCENYESAEMAVRKLNETGKGRCRFVILDRIPPFSGKLETESILNRIGCPDNLKPVIAVLSANANIDDKGNVRGTFWLAGGTDNAVSSEPYWGEEAEIKEKIEILDKEKNSLEENIRSMRNELENRNRQALSSRERIIKINLELNTAETKAKAARESLKSNKERIRLIDRNKDNAEKELKKTMESAGQFEKALNEARSVSDVIRKEQAVIDEQKKKLNEEFALHKENFAVCRSELENFSHKLESMQSELMRSEEDLKSMVEEKNHFAIRRLELDKKEKDVIDSTSQSSARLEVVLNDLAENEIKNRQIEDIINKNSLEFARIENNAKDSRALFAENEKKRIRLETEIEAYKARIEESSCRIAENWNMDLKTAEEKYGGIEADRERVVFLRRRVAAMGPVNMTAPEEHEAVSQRYAFIISQSEDLKKAENDLRSAIAKINDTTKNNFKATFAKVREYFKEIYSLLFNGGEADLILTEPDNLLETGVEIMAHPPGKRLVSITQLSGGEKALTALALLFSFFRVSPSPFCIMDETDAPLDEANVERFVRLIREFSSATQFLVITHNKRTMEAAETLYGITMEELGVSKLVSVDLKHAADMAEQSSATE